MYILLRDIMKNIFLSLVLVSAFSAQAMQVKGLKAPRDIIHIRTLGDGSQIYLLHEGKDKEIKAFLYPSDEESSPIVATKKLKSQEVTYLCNSNPCEIDPLVLAVIERAIGVYEKQVLREQRKHVQCLRAECRRAECLLAERAQQ